MGLFRKNRRSNSIRPIVDRIFGFGSAGPGSRHCRFARVYIGNPCGFFRVYQISTAGLRSCLASTHPRTQQALSSLTPTESLEPLRHITLSVHGYAITSSSVRRALLRRKDSFPTGCCYPFPARHNVHQRDMAWSRLTYSDMGLYYGILITRLRSSAYAGLEAWAV